MSKILLAGATGYLGNYIMRELIANKIETKIIVRSSGQINLSPEVKKSITVLQAELTQPASILNCCNGIDTVITTVGITKPKDGFTYMEIDYQANLNLLKEAQKSGVRKFIYISIYQGENLKSVAICKAKEKFVAALKKSGLAYCVIRPTGYFSDMAEFYNLAKKGRVYLFGKGDVKINPIHGADLATACVKAINGVETEINIGGPQTMTYTGIAQLAFKVLNKKPKITYFPNWIRRIALPLAKIFMSKQNFGPIEFLMAVMATDMNAPEYGSHLLEGYFKELNTVNNM